MDQQLTNEIESLKARVKALENTQQHITTVIDNISSKQDDNNSTLKEIKEALLGDAFRSSGVIDDVKENREDIRHLKKFKTQLVAYTAGASGAVVSIIEVIMRFL